MQIHFMKQYGTHCCSSDSRKVERVQERVLRAFYCNNVTEPSIMKNFYRLPIHQSFVNVDYRKSCVIMCKVKNNIAPTYISDLFTTNASCYALRHSNLTMLRFNTVTHGKFSISYLGLIIWTKT